MGMPAAGLGTRILIAGLGNPGPEYRATRHNAGFMALDRLAARLPKGNFTQFHGCASWYLKGNYAGKALFLQKPETFMNRSGEAVAALMRREKVESSGLLVIYDDMDLAVGQLRIRERGSGGGHHGMESVMEHLGSWDFARIRIGIGRRTGNGADYVLSPFEPTETAVMDKVLDAAAEAAVMIVRGGIRRAMNQYNPLDFALETAGPGTAAETTQSTVEQR